MEHPITPPQELVQQLRAKAPVAGDGGAIREQWIATQAARWGADQELEVIIHWLITGPYGASITAAHSDLFHQLRAARRPKPPSIAVQALQELEDAVMRGDCITTTDAMPALRKALARLFELEALSND